MKLQVSAKLPQSWMIFLCLFHTSACSPRITSYLPVKNRPKKLQGKFVNCSGCLFKTKWNQILSLPPSFRFFCSKVVAKNTLLRFSLKDRSHFPLSFFLFLISCKSFQHARSHSLSELRAGHIPVHVSHHLRGTLQINISDSLWWKQSNKVSLETFPQ